MRSTLDVNERVNRDGRSTKITDVKQGTFPVICSLQIKVFTFRLLLYIGEELVHERRK